MYRTSISLHLSLIKNKASQEQDKDRQLDLRMTSSLSLHRRSKSSHTAHDFWRHFQQRPLDAIFRPKSVALVGASAKEGSVGRTMLWNLVSSPFGGTIYPVNNNRHVRRDNIFGIRSYRRVQDIPERGIDLAIIAVPAGVVKNVSISTDPL